MNRETIEKIKALSLTIKEDEIISSELLRTAQDRGGEIKHKLEREGKEIELEEKILWDETFYLGVQCPAAKILIEKYPEVFEAFNKQNRHSAELKKYCIESLSIDYTKMTITDFISISEKLFKLLMEEKNGN